MAHIRTLKPEFFRSRSLARCSIPARLTFAGLWCEADDAGRGVADADILKGAIWPKDADITPDSVERHLHELAQEHIVLYEMNGERYYAVLNWSLHQSAAFRRAEPKFPPPPQEPVSDGKNTPSPAETFFARERMQAASEGVLNRKGKEGKGEEGRGDDNGKRRGTTVPDIFPITDEMRAWATEAGIKSDLKRETYKFLDHYRAKDERRKDWVASWRNWLRKADEFANDSNHSRNVQNMGPVTRSRKDVALGDVRAYRDTGQSDLAEALQAQVDAGEFD